MFVKLEILLFKVEVERTEGAGVNTNPFVTVPCSTPKKKIKLKPKNLVFQSPESSLISPSYVTPCSPISAAVHSVAGPCSSVGGDGEEQNLSLLHSRGLLPPAEDLITPVGPDVPLPSTSTNPFLSFSSTVPAGAVASGGTGVNNGGMGGPSGSFTHDIGAVSQPPVVSSTPVLSTPVKPFLGDGVGRLVCSASVPGRQRVQFNPRSSIQSLGRRSRSMQVVKGLFFSWN